MTMRHLITPILLVTALAFPALAQATPDDVLSDCAVDGSVDEKHSDKDKRAALRNVPGDVKEYTDCEAEIAASIAGKGKSSSNPGEGDGTGGSGGSFDPDTNGDGVVSPAERAAADKRERELARLDGQLADRGVDPRDAAAFADTDAASGLSLPAILALVALSLLTLGAGLYVLWRRNPELLRRVQIPFRRS